MTQRFYDLNTHLRAAFGCRVQKITVDAGLSCPNRDGTISTGGCIFCNARGSGTGAHAQGLSVTDQIVAAKARLARRYRAKKFIAYFQSFTNTHAPVEHLRRLYTEALAVPDVVGISVGTRPDCVPPPVLDLLEACASRRLVWVEYGLQSARDRTLLRINRGHDAACFARAVAATRDRGIRICAHVILGLPGETHDHMMETADFIAGLGVHGVKIHLLYVVRDTPLHRMHDAGRFACMDQGAYVETVCDVLERLPPDMVVQRLTGDPHPGELIAPAWSLDKARTLALIHRTLESRGTWQGRGLGGNRLDIPGAVA